jgi:hypothetical protein
MASLIHERCFNHARREAVARCPECGRFFCRECVTEHEGRVVCAACLGAQLHPAPIRSSLFGRLLLGFQVVVGLSGLWLIFYFLGEVLLTLPSSFHEGTVWRDTFEEKP